MHRFHVLNLGQEGAVFTLSPGQSRQIARVLRLSPGDCITVFDGRGRVGEAAIEAIGPRGVSVRLSETREAAWPLAWRPVLYLSLIRPQRFEWAVEKAAELGAWAIVPITCARTAHGGDSVSPARLARWQQIAAEAAEQCGAVFVPDVRSLTPLTRALREPADGRLVAWEGRVAPSAERLTTVFAAARPAADCPPLLALYVGPEGGFTAEEARAALEAGCRAVSLGPRTLRAETAAVAALATMLALSTSETT